MSERGYQAFIKRPAFTTREALEAELRKRRRSYGISLVLFIVMGAIFAASGFFYDLRERAIPPATAMVSVFMMSTFAIVAAMKYAELLDLRRQLWAMTDNP